MKKRVLIAVLLVSVLMITLMITIVAAFSWDDFFKTLTGKAVAEGNVVAKYDFNSDATDSVGANHGTLVGNTYVENGRLVLDGSGDYVEIPYSSDFNLNTYTVSTWVKLSGAAKSTGSGVFGTRVVWDYTFDFKIRPTNIHGDLGMGSWWLTTVADCSQALESGTWYHIVYSVDEDNYDIYVNGIRCSGANLATASLLMKSNQKMRIGHTGYGSEWFNGQIDNVRIFNDALTDELVLSLYNDEKGGFEGPVSCSETDEGIDYSTKGTSCIGASCKTDYCLSATNLREYYLEEEGILGGGLCDSLTDIFSEDYICPNGCVDGACVEGGCTDECVLGYKRCIKSNEYTQTCGNYDSDECTEWGGDFQCSESEICRNGECESIFKTKLYGVEWTDYDEYTKVGYDGNEVKLTFNSLNNDAATISAPNAPMVYVDTDNALNARVTFTSALAGSAGEYTLSFAKDSHLSEDSVLPILSTAGGRTIHVTENASIKLNEYTIIDSGDKGRIVQVTEMPYDLPVSVSDKLQLTDVITGENLLGSAGLSLINQGDVAVGTTNIDGQPYYFEVSEHPYYGMLLKITWGVGASYGDVGYQYKNTTSIKLKNGNHLALGLLNDLVGKYNLELPYGIIYQTNWPAVLFIETTGDYILVPLDKSQTSTPIEISVREPLVSKPGEAPPTPQVCQDLIDKVQNPVDFVDQGIGWECNDGYNYEGDWWINNKEEHAKEYSSYCNANYDDKWQYISYYVTIFDNQNIDLTQWLDDRVSYEVCVPQSYWSNDNKENKVYICNWDVLRQEQSLDNYQYKSRQVLWINDNVLVELYTYTSEYITDEELAKLAQKRMNDFLNDLRDNRYEYTDWEDFNIDYPLSRQVELSLSQCPSQVSLDVCYPCWSCKVEPIICPEYGEQKKTCVDNCCDNEDVVTYESCNPGICSGCIIPKWFDYARDTKCIPYGFRFAQQTGWDYEFVEGTEQEILEEGEDEGEYKMEILSSTEAVLTLYSRDGEEFRYELTEGTSVDIDIQALGWDDDVISLTIYVKDIVYSSQEGAKNYVDAEITMTGYDRVASIINAYCDIDGQVKQQKTKTYDGSWAKCMNSYECESNLCSGGECVEINDLLKQGNAIKVAVARILCRLTDWFGIDSYENCLVETIGYVPEEPPEPPIPPTPPTTCQDAVNLATSTQKLYYNSVLSTARVVLTKNELPTLLADGEVTDDAGTDYSYTQQIFPGGNVKIDYSNSYGDFDDPNLLIEVGTDPVNYLYKYKVTFNRLIDIGSEDVQGNAIEVLNKKYIIGAGSGIGGGDGELYLYSVENPLTLNEGESATVELDGQKHTIEVVGIDTSGVASIRVDGGSIQEIAEGASKQVGGIEIYVLNSFYSSKEGSENYAQLLINTQKIKLDHGSTVYLGEDLNAVYGTKVNFDISGDLLSALEINIAMQKATKDYIKLDETYTDPVFGTLNVKFASATPALDAASRGRIMVDTDNNLNARVTFTSFLEQDEGEFTLNFAHDIDTSESAVTPALATAGNKKIHVQEVDWIKLNEYTIIDSGDKGRIVQLTEVPSGGIISTTSDKIQLTDAISGENLLGSGGLSLTIVNNKGYATTNIDGQPYYFSVDPRDNQTVMITYGSGAGQQNYGSEMSYGKIKLANGEHLALGDLTLLGAIYGFLGELYDLNLPEGSYETTWPAVLIIEETGDYILIPLDKSDDSAPIEISVGEPVALGGVWSGLQSLQSDAYKKRAVTEYGSFIQYDAIDNDAVYVWYPEEKMYMDIFFQCSTSGSASSGGGGGGSS